MAKPFLIVVIKLLSTKQTIS